MQGHEEEETEDCARDECAEKRNCAAKKMVGMSRRSIVDPKVLWPESRFILLQFGRSFLSEVCMGILGEAVTAAILPI